LTEKNNVIDLVLACCCCGIIPVRQKPAAIQADQGFSVFAISKKSKSAMSSEGGTMANDALIGFTGFVGGQLDRRLPLAARYNSRNIAEMRGMTFDTVYCAGVSAVKWLANREPERDLMGIIPLLTALEDVKAERFVLISTIDVYRDPVDVDEDTPISTEDLHPYGTHRRLLENFVRERFPRHHIIRLPGLFGEGLKKNIIFDLLHDHRLDQIDSAAVFQFYNLECLARDIGVTMQHELRLVNFATEPVSVGELATRCFARKLVPGSAVDSPRYDMKTRYAEFFGSSSPYLYSRDRVLADLGRFVAVERGKWCQ
jgi:nucleoside-diphosphate-sugar epimerase